MKKASIGLATFSLVAIGLVIPHQNRIFRGEIMDSFCAEMGSHETISASVKDSRACTLDCVKGGAKFVLYSPTRNKSYGLDDQRAPRIFAGEKVRIIGTYNSTTNTIHVVDIEPTLLETVRQFAANAAADFSGR